MMRKKINCGLILTFFIAIVSLNAQNSTPNSNGDFYVAQKHLEEVFNKENFKDVNYAYIEGSAYVSDNYQEALVIYKGKKLGKFSVKYNAFLDQMETPNEKGGIGALRKSDDLSIKLNNETYCSLNFEGKSSGVEQSYFVEKVMGDNCSLYQRRFKTLKEAEEAKTSFHQGSATKFIDHSDYYLKLGDNPLRKVKLKKSKVLASFPEHGLELKAFVKEQKLDLTTENGLKQLVVYYNSLDKASS